MTRAQERANAIRKAVEEYVTEGYSPWPCRPGDKMPINAGKDRRSWGGKAHKPLTAEERIETWRSSSPPDVALIITSGHWVLDLDPKNNPDVKRLFPSLLGMTRCAYTPSGGLHAFFRLPDGESAPTIDPALGVDVQGRGSLVIVPPSINRSWANDLPEMEWSGTFD